MEYDPDQFRGAAPYYLRGRPPYSADLAAVLADELGLDGTGRLLDVGCGPGTVGVELAALFEHVTFLESDAEMLAAARAHADALTSAYFRRATAEQLADLDLPPMRVVTFGQSFHRTDRMVAAEAAYDVLEPGGSVALITHDPTRPAPPEPSGTVPIPHEAIMDLIRRYLGDELRSGGRPASSYDTERFERTLARTRFGDQRAAYAAGRPDIVRGADDIVANYLSMSFALPHRFGSRFAEFVRDVHTLLAEASPDGRFWDWPGDTQILIATHS